MGFLFNTPTAPQPVAVPQSPTAPNNVAAEKQRQDAEQAAVAESKSYGRRSTIVAGMDVSASEQAGTGLLSAKKRAAARDLGS